MKQIRIYYESIEQGYNYIRPIVKSVAKDTEIIMVRRPKKANDVNKGSISALLTMTTPDVLITGISNNIEYPLILIEFTEAVTTEDHELQRTYGAIAAYLSGAYYIKISAEKESEKEFGGAKYNPYSTSKIFIDKFNYEGYIIANWETLPDNKYTLRRNPNYPSCPDDIVIFTDTIECVVHSFLFHTNDWYNTGLKNLKKKESYKLYRNLVDKADGTNKLLESWGQRTDTNLNKLRYFVSDTDISAKINRFSHAMDPDRGILTFISFLFSENRNIYGIYALVRPRGNNIMKKDMTSLSIMKKKFKIAIEMDKGGLPEWLVNELNKVVQNAKSITNVIDFQSVWEEHKNEITENKVVLTLAYFLDGIKLNHNGIMLKWDKRKLINTTDKNFVEAFAKNFYFTKYTIPTPICKITQEVDEDEVTYSIIHKVLIPNGFNIVSVSYPGAQGSMAVLPEPEKGKAQPREYPDIIATAPKESSIDIILNESKGMFVKSQVEKDLNKMLLYKTDSNHKQALQESLIVAQVINKNKELKNIVIGVSFGATSKTKTNWNPANVDFIFRIVDRKNWNIGIFRQELKDLIKVIEGKTSFPDIYKCSKDKDNE
ncbi:MAG: hypothetical protein II878_02240 [Bacteroidales bacterium]|nr:hypothetical protein [Bacteroidales bacterium]